MGQRVGLIAGGGEFPLHVLAQVKKRGGDCVVAALRGAASPFLQNGAEVFEWFQPAEIERLVRFFKSRDIRDVILAGKVEHRTVLQDGQGTPDAVRILSRLPDRSPAAVLKALLEYLETNGLQILDPASFLAPFLLPEGGLGGGAPSASVAGDIAFGWPRAKALADLDIGQTLVVKGLTVVAVEGMDGTDETIRRGSRIAGDGIVVLKVGRTRQETRIDVPAVGLETVRMLVGVRAAALAIEAGQVPFFQKDEAAALAEAGGLVILIKK